MVCLISYTHIYIYIALLIIFLLFEKKLVVFYFRKNENLQLDDDHIITILKWAQNRISSLNDLVTKDLAFLWIVPSSMPNVKQIECSGTNIFFT